MKKNRIVVLVLISITIMSNKCYNKKAIENRLLIENTFDFEIYVIPSFIFPDTSLDFTSKDFIVANRSSILVPPKSTVRITNLSLCFENEWKRLVPSDTLQLFVFERKLIDEEKWSDVYKDYKVLRRCNFTLLQVLERNCTLKIE